MLQASLGRTVKSPAFKMPERSDCLCFAEAAGARTWFPTTLEIAMTYPAETSTKVHLNCGTNNHAALVPSFAQVLDTIIRSRGLQQHFT
eukprot:scaffold3373_cov137-Cylindrotheca_fusiformis.AAC.2